MAMSQWVRLIAIDLVVSLLWSVAVGASAPYWPSRWLVTDRFPLRLTRWDSVSLYRSVGIIALKDHLPEAGAMFGGQSKRSLRGTDAAALRVYLTEVRRAEWVHWISMASWIPLVWFNPWPLTAAFAIVVIGVNVPFILTVRFNRIRLLRLVR